MLVNYEYYRIFYYVAKYQNFTRAAAELDNNQPNISRSIKNLENALGCVLFSRTSRGVKLTPEGETLYSHIVPAILQIEAGEKELLMQKELKSGVVSIGTTETALSEVLLPVLDMFHKEFPEIRIRINNSTTPAAMNALKSGAVDFSVVTSPIEDDDEFEIFYIKKFNDIPVCGKELSFLKDRAIGLGEIKEYPLISLNKGSSAYDFYSKLFAENGLQYAPDTEVATADLILPLVKNNLGIGFLPANLVKNDLKNGEIFKLNLKGKIPSRQICIAENKNVRLGVAANELKIMLLDYCQNFGE